MSNPDKRGDDIAILSEDKGHTHKWQMFEIFKSPTCTRKGEDKYICWNKLEDGTSCREIKWVKTDMLPHNYEEKIIPPTFEEQGYTEYTCKYCGDSKGDNYTKKLEPADPGKGTTWYDMVMYPVMTPAG